MRPIPLCLGCTAMRHRAIGVNAVINASGGEPWRNDMSQDEIEMERDGRAINDRINHRVRFYNVYSRFFRRHRNRVAHLISSREE